MNQSSRSVLLLLLSLHWLGSSEASKPLDLSPSAEAFPADFNSDSGTTNSSVSPVLQPKESVPPQLTYTLMTPAGKMCVRASLGVEYVVKVKKRNYYFNLSPNSARATGYCREKEVKLSLDFDGGHLEFTFMKDGDLSYVKTVKGQLTPAPPCKNCKSKSYTGIMDNEKLFKVKNGLSFNCKSQTTLLLANDFRVKLVPLQIQAFDLPGGVFGKEYECWADFNKRMIPIILGAVAVAIFLIAIVTFVLVREHRNRGYEQL